MTRQLNPLEVSELLNLRAHWGDVYKITYEGELWRATPHTDLTTTLTGESAEELRQLIRVHYRQNPALQFRHTGGDAPESQPTGDETA